MYVNSSVIRTCTPVGVLRVISRAADFVMRVSKSLFYSFLWDKFLVGRMILDILSCYRSLPCPRFGMRIVKAVRLALDQWSWVVPFQLRVHRNDSGSCLPSMSKQT